MKEQSDLTPIVDAYTEYKKCRQEIEDSLELLEGESDEDMREMIKETLGESRKRVEELEQELKILLLPKDPKRSGQAREGTRRRCSRRRSIGCTCTTRRASGGRWRR